MSRASRSVNRSPRRRSPVTSGNRAVRAGGAQCCTGESEFLSPRSQIQLKRPSASLLKVEIIVSFRYGLGREKRVTPSFQEQLSVPLRLDLPIDDHMSNVNPFWAEFPRHGLGKSAQAKFRNSEIGEPSAAAQRRGGAGKDNGSSCCGQHKPCGLAADHESAKTAKPPTTIEIVWMDVNNVASFVGAGIEDNEIGTSQFRHHRLE